MALLIVTITFSCSACNTLACVFSFVVCSEWFLCSINKLLCSTYLWTGEDRMSIYVNTWLGAKGTDRRGGISKRFSSRQVPDNFAWCPALRKARSQKGGMGVPGTAEILSVWGSALPLCKKSNVPTTQVKVSITWYTLAFAISLNKLFPFLNGMEHTPNRGTRDTTCPTISSTLLKS